MPESISFVDSIKLTLDKILKENKSAILIGEGVPDPKAVFNSTKGLKEKYPLQVYDMPVSEAGLTGVCIGLAIGGYRPIMIHQRIDFALYAMDQIVNNAAKWHSMYGGKSHVPLVIRMIIGRGWGQGHQHSQNLSGLFASIPGLKVVMPSNAINGAVLLEESFKDNNPVMFIEHRWIHNTQCFIDETKKYNYKIGKAEVKREGKDITIVSWSYMIMECMKAAEFLDNQGISCEVIDLLSLRPLDYGTIYSSVCKTKRFLVVEEAWNFNSISGEIISFILEGDSHPLVSEPIRLNCPNFYVPSSSGLAKSYYPTISLIVDNVAYLMGLMINMEKVFEYESKRIHDIPDENFKGPF